MTSSAPPTPLKGMLPSLPGDRPAARKEQLLFLHIPKTAGSSFTRILKSLYDEEEIFHQMDTPSLIELLDSGDFHHRLYIGHYYYDVLRKFSRWPWLFPLAGKRRPLVLTFLREPRQRVASHYYYYRKQPDEAIEKMPEWDKYIVKLTRQYGFAEFISLDLPEVEQAFSNVHTRQLANNTDFEMPQRKAGRKALLSLATKHLRQLDFIGIVEEFDRSLELFRHRFGVAEELEPVRVNANRDRPREPEELAVFTRNPIAAGRVELDLALYRRGLEIFERNFAAVVDGDTRRE